MEIGPAGPAGETVEREQAAPSGPGRGSAVVHWRGRRRPSGEPPPLPRSLETTGRSLVLLTSALVVLWVVAVVSGVGRSITLAEQAFIDWVAGLRTGTLTQLALAVHALGSLWVVRVLRWSTVLALVAFRRFRHLFVFLGTSLAVTGLVTVAQYLLQRPRPLDVVILGSWEGFSHPSRPMANLAVSSMAVLYTLIPQGRVLLSLAVMAGIISALAVAIFNLRAVGLL